MLGRGQGERGQERATNIWGALDPTGALDVMVGENRTAAGGEGRKGAGSRHTDRAGWGRREFGSRSRWRRTVEENLDLGQSRTMESGTAADVRVKESGSGLRAGVTVG